MYLECLSLHTLKMLRFSLSLFVISAATYYNCYMFIKNYLSSQAINIFVISKVIQIHNKSKIYLSKKENIDYT